MGLHLNTEKIQYMEVSREINNAPVTEIITVGYSEFKKVERFKCLIIIVTQKNECQEIIKLGNRCFYTSNNLLSSRILLKVEKIQLYLTITRPIVMYGLQCWTLRIQRTTDYTYLREKCYENMKAYI